MKLSRRFSTIALNLIVPFVIMSCGKPAMVSRTDTSFGIDKTHETAAYNESLVNRLERLKGSGPITAKGKIRMQKADRNVKGDFSMTIDGEDMSMSVSSKGISAGKIELTGLTVRMEPSFDDEYLEYMIAVVIRDSISWWNIHNYDITRSYGMDVLRNSWKKVYIDPDLVLPRKQIISLTKQRFIKVEYDGLDNGQSKVVPGTIQFMHGDMKCELLIDSLEVNR